MVPLLRSVARESKRARSRRRPWICPHKRCGRFVADPEGFGYDSALSVLSRVFSPDSALPRSLLRLSAVLWLATITVAPRALANPAPVGDSPGEPLLLAEAEAAPSPAADGSLYTDSEDALDAEFDWEPEELAFPDPMEEVNRGILSANRTLDRFLFEPVTKGYRFLVPAPARAAVRRAFLNVGSVSVLANDILQLDLPCARNTLLRLVVNTTVGVGGLFDPATQAGVEAHDADFGQTLANMGIGSGPYVMLPLFGPSTSRDAFGTLVDTLLQPAFYLLGPAQRLTVGGGFGISTRDAHGEALTALEESSLDFYAALRNAFYQSRIAELEEERSCVCSVPDEEAAKN